MITDSRIAIIGLGYFGLPLAVEFSKVHAVVGFDTNAVRIRELSVCNDRTRKGPAQLEYIRVLEGTLVIDAQMEFLPLQSSGVPNTEADTSVLEEWIDYKPSVSVDEGIERFVKWFRNYHQVKVYAVRRVRLSHRPSHRELLHIYERPFASASIGTSKCG